MNLEEMGLRDFISMVIRRKVILIAFLLAAMLVSAVVNLFFIIPTYQASATLLLTKTTSTSQGADTALDYSTLLLNKQLIKTYQSLATSRSVLDSVIKTVNINLTVDQLKNMVSIELMGDTELLKVIVNSPNPEQAVLIANTVGNVFVERIPSLMKIDNVLLVDRAERPLKPVQPHVGLNVFLAGISGLLLGLGTILVQEYFANAIYSPQEVQKHLALPILGTSPKLTNQLPLVTFDCPHSGSAEAYRILRTNLIFANLPKEPGVLLVTSANAQEGKSLVTANLGISLAQMGKRVLIIDGDLRTPTQHLLFGLKQTQGLTNLLSGQSSVSESIKQTKVPGVKLLTSGQLPQNPVELLGSARLPQILAEAGEISDVVLIDSPAVVAVIDAAILANLVDSTLLVIRPGVSSIATIKLAQEQLQKAKARILGTVFNGGQVED